MTTPPLIIAYRAITVVIALAIIALVGLGMAGHGPLGGLLGSLLGPGVNT
jgi:hypothetical protein